MEITDKALYLNRRAFIAAAVGAAASVRLRAQAAGHGRRFENVVGSALSTDERPNPWEHITGYNNYYEFASTRTCRRGRRARSARRRGPSPSPANAIGPRRITSRTYPPAARSRSASTAIAASKAGRW